MIHAWTAEQIINGRTLTTRFTASTHDAITILFALATKGPIEVSNEHFADDESVLIPKFASRNRIEKNLINGFLALDPA